MIKPPAITSGSTRADGKFRFCIKCGKDGSSREWRQEEIEKLIGDFTREWMPHTPELQKALTALETTQAEMKQMKDDHEEMKFRLTVLENKVDDLMAQGENR